MIRSRAWPAVMRTTTIMLATGTTFAAVGALYTGASCTAASIREKHDMWNGVIGGLAAGQVFFLRTGKIGRGIGAGAAMAVASAAVDGSGSEMKQLNYFNDGHTVGHTIFPYKK